MKALLYTSDPYEPSGVVGLYETEEQKQEILRQAREQLYQEEFKQQQWRLKPQFYEGKLRITEVLTKEELMERCREQAELEASYLKEIEIPIGVYGEYYS